MDVNLLDTVNEGIARSREQGVILMNDRHDLQSKMDSLRNELDVLQKQNTILETQSKASAEEARNYLLCFLDAHCRLLCHMLQKKLPRELRDMVYSFLCPSKSVRVSMWDNIRSDGVFGFWPKFFDEHTKRHTLQWPEFDRDERVLKVRPCTVARLGQDALYELAEYYYSRSHFQVMLEGNLLSTFISTDYACVGIDPAKLLSSITVDLDTNAFVQASANDESKQELLHELQSLFTIRTGARLHFTLYKEDTLPRVATRRRPKDAQTLEMIFPTLSGLKEAGYVLSLMLYNRCWLSCDEQNFSIQGLLDDLSIQQQKWQSPEGKNIGMTMPPSGGQNDIA
ncbi:hypothetical protein K491DRAFT_784732 [Lophiostoma macrostomum CBS 122681]|uniref:Uncharacterized protein n=1 Tax=Lophiostoma macrostomum CBS 122681 TaxID=1314788 RepID=A0A6A6SKB0_9PLEO|nr:hypothetical protein K491DRAFT_784732 [Lophiostoma macrostomum CBS 122681]